MDYCFIDHIETENQGGGMMLDFVILKDGRVLGVDGESVVLYQSMEHFHSYEHEGCPVIDLTEAA